MSESHAAVVSDSPRLTVGGQRTAGVMRSLHGYCAWMLRRALTNPSVHLRDRHGMHRHHDGTGSSPRR